jgi:hypothetical protein
MNDHDLYKKLDEQDEKTKELFDKLLAKIDKLSTKVDLTYDKVFLFDGLIVDVEQLKKEREKRQKLTWLLIGQILVIPITVAMILIKSLL